MNYGKTKQRGTRHWVPLLALSLALIATVGTANAFGAVEYLGTDSGESGGSGTSFSFAITIPAGTTLVVGMGQTSQGQNITGMTLEGGSGGNVNMIKLTDTEKEPGKNERTCMFYLINPPSNASAARVHYPSDFKGKIGGVAYFKGVELSEPIGLNDGLHSNDPFNGPSAVVPLSALPWGSALVTCLSANKGDQKIKNAVAGGDYLTGGGTSYRLYTRWPSSSSFVGGIVASGLAELILPPANGRFTGAVNPNWNSYDGNGTASILVVNPTKSAITYVSSPANTGTFSGGASGVFPGTGSTSFTVAPNAGYSFASISNSGGQLGGTFPNFTLSQLDGNATVTATFTPIMRTVSYATVTGATISGSATVQDTIGTANFSVAVQPGYQLVGTPTSTSGTVTADGANWKLTNVKANATVSATIQPIMHTVGYSPTTEGSVTGAATIQNTIGTIPVTVSTNAGYAFDGISASNGTLNGSYPNFTLVNVTANTTVTATFLGVHHHITPAVSTVSPDTGAVGGTVTDFSGPIQDSIGTVNFTVTTNPGYVLTGPTATNGTIGGSYPNFTLSGVTANTTVTVTFTNSRPVINVNPASIELQCGATYTLAMARLGMTASDPEDGVINPQTVVIGGDPLPFTGLGTYTITYNVNDKAGLAAVEQTRTVSIVDTTAPAITLNGEGAVTLECGVDSYVELGATASDVCDGSVTVDITGSVDMDTPDVYTITYEATDSEGNTGSATRTVTVVDTTAPVITRTGDKTVTAFVGQAYVDEGATVTDNCDTAVTVQTSGTVDTNTPGEYTVKYNAVDASGNVAEEKTRTVNVISLIDPSIVSVVVDSEFSVVVNWNQGIQVMDDALVAANYTVSGSGAGSLSANPTSVVQDSANAVRLIWTNAGEMLNGKDITITVNPALENNFGNVIDGNSSTDPEGAVGIAPVITLNGGDVTLECSVDSYTELGATATDNVDGDVNVVISGNVDEGAVGAYTITYTATDAVGNVATETLTVTVEDTAAPVIVLNGDAAMEAGCGYDLVDPGYTATDACEGDVSGKVVVGGDSVDSAAAGAVFTISYNVVDDAGNVATTVTRTVTIVDNEGPDITLTGDNPLILDGAAEYIELGAVAIDACDGVDYTDDIVIDGEVNALMLGDYEVTYTVSDGADNETVVVRTVSVTRDACQLVYTVDITPNPAVPGETVVMTATAAGASCSVGDIHFQWEKRGADKGDDFLPIPSADDGDSFVIAAVDFDDAGDYRCTISDTTFTANSNVVTLEVGTGVPALSGLGMLLASAAALAAGATALRRKRD